MPAVAQQGMAAVATPRSLIITAASAAALQTAVDAQTNTLNKRLVSPAAGQQTGGIGGVTGGVVNGTIVIIPLASINSSSNVVTFVSAVNWTEWIVPA